MTQYRAPPIQKPSMSQMEEIAKKFGFHMSPEELAEYKDLVDGGIASLSRIDDIPEPVLLPVKYPRTPGYRPPPEENKYNAWYYKTDIKGASSGKLHGKRAVLKDNVAVAGVPMMNGTKLLEGYIPEYDATVVTRILDAGGHIAGKATCENMSFGGTTVCADTGPVLNPYDITRSAGGSSSGTAVLIHNGEVDIGIGADQGGSIRIPATWVGIVGLKPTWGLVPYTGVFPIEPSMDHVGPMARTVHDCALLLEVIAGSDNGLDQRQPPDLKIPAYTDLLGGDLSGMKIGLLQEGFKVCENDVATLVLKAGQSLGTTGATVEMMSVPMHEHGTLIWTGPCGMGSYITMVQNAACGLGMKGFHPTSLIDHMTKSLKTNGNDMSKLIKLACLQWEYIQQNYGTRYYTKGQNMTVTLTKAYDEALTKHDVIIMPTTAYKAPKLPAQDTSLKDFVSNCLGMVANTAAFDSTGHPALTINAGFSEGLPVGMMIVGKKFDEATVLKVAHAFEKIRDSKK